MGYLHQGLSIVPDGKETEQLRGLYYYMLGVVLTYQHLDSEALEMQLKSFSIYRFYKGIINIFPSEFLVFRNLKIRGCGIVQADGEYASVC